MHHAEPVMDPTVSETFIYENILFLSKSFLRSHYLAVSKVVSRQFNYTDR